MTMLSPKREVGEFKKRYKWMALVVVVVFALLIGRMVQLQLVQHEAWAHVARENITKTISLPATRGIVRDSKGRVVADNEPSYSVFVTPQLLDLDRDVDRIGELMGMNAAERRELRERIEDVPARRRTHQIEMFEDISRDQLAALETHSTELAGVDVVADPVRTYPFERLGAHAIGYVNEVNAEDLEAHPDQGYRAGDVIGRTGVERAWESYLRGRAGQLRVTVDARGRLQDGRGPDGRFEPPERTEPVPGRDLTLTVDMDLMRAVKRAFRGRPSGGTVVIEVNTGRVRALFSKPSYDLNEMSGRLTQERFEELRDNPFRPLIDKTVYDTYFPGSTFKPISALSALEDEALDPHKHVDCPGYYELGNREFGCTQAHGEVDMRAALVQSCNVYFYRLGEQVGLDRLAHYARVLGFGTPSGIGINTETSGFIANKQWYVDQWGEPYRLGFTLNSAIGQGNTRVTLLQLGLAYAAIANGGDLYVPQLVERVSEPDGRVIEDFEPRVRRHVDVNDESLSYIMSGLRGVVNEPDGTAYKARIEGGVRVAGKTGTAEVSRRGVPEGEDEKRAWYWNRDHAWFVGLAPADEPEVVIVTIVEHGGSGGKTAAPIGLQVLEEYLGGDEEEEPKAAARDTKGEGSVLAVTGRQ